MINRIAAIVMLAIAGTAALTGLQLCLFDIDVRRMGSAAGTTFPAERTRWVQEADPKVDVAVLMSPWRDKAIVGGIARRIIASDGNSGASGARHLLDIAAVLSVKPTDGRQWLAYADQTLRMGYGDGSALKALDMSALTDRRQTDIMVARARFVLGAWDRMPLDTREYALAPIAELRWSLGDPARLSLAEVIVRLPPAVRSEIAAFLAPKLGGDRGFQKSLGL